MTPFSEKEGNGKAVAGRGRAIAGIAPRAIALTPTLVTSAPAPIRARRDNCGNAGPENRRGHREGKSVLNIKRNWQAVAGLALGLAARWAWPLPLLGLSLALIGLGLSLLALKKSAGPGWTRRLTSILGIVLNAFSLARNLFVLILIAR